MELLFLLNCRIVLDFSVPDYRYYNSVALCALDAAFSAQAKYGAVTHVIHLLVWTMVGVGLVAFGFVVRRDSICR